MEDDFYYKENKPGNTVMGSGKNYHLIKFKSSKIWYGCMGVYQSYLPFTKLYC
jgi:hypothetical protein